MKRYQPLIGDIYNYYGNRIISLLILMTLVSVGEGISIALLLPLLNEIGITGSGNENIISVTVKSLFDMIGVEFSIISIVGLLFVIFVFQSGLFILQSWRVATMQRNYAAAWQRRLFDSLIHAKWSHLVTKKSGELVNAIIVETGRLAGAFMVIAQVFTTFTVSVGYVIIALLVSWEITSSLVILAAILFFIGRRISRKTYDIGLMMGPLNSKLHVMLGEYLSGVKLIKTTVTEDKAVKKVSDVVNELRKHHTTATFLPNFVRGIFEFVSLLAICILLVVSHEVMDVPPANMLVVLALFIRIFPRFITLQHNIHSLNAYAPAIIFIKELFDESEANKEGNTERENKSIVNVTSNSSVTIKGLSAGYNEKCILQDVNMTFPEKGYIGIVGESGAGKTTLINCIIGLAEISKGEIYIGEVPFSDCSLEKWRSLIGYVAQESILFHMTIRENIAWGKENSSDEEIIRAAVKANAHNFINELPDGYDTIVGDQGTRLSGGQRQRIAISRALLTKPKILLLDEATSALDSNSEKVVIDALKEISKSILIISIAHRLSTVKNAEKIFVINDGLIRESGEWTSLIEAGGWFFNMARAQHLV